MNLEKFFGKTEAWGIVMWDKKKGVTMRTKIHLVLMVMLLAVTMAVSAQTTNTSGTPVPEATADAHSTLLQTIHVVGRDPDGVCHLLSGEPMFAPNGEPVLDANGQQALEPDYGGAKGAFVDPNTTLTVPANTWIIYEQKDDSLENLPRTALIAPPGTEIVFGEYGGHIWVYWGCTLTQLTVEYGFFGPFTAQEIEQERLRVLGQINGQVGAVSTSTTPSLTTTPAPSSSLECVRWECTTRECSCADWK